MGCTRINDAAHEMLKYRSMRPEDLAAKLGISLYDLRRAMCYDLNIIRVGPKLCYHTFPDERGHEKRRNTSSF